MIHDEICGWGFPYYLTSMEADISSCILATGGYDHQVRLWRVDNGSSYRTFQHADSVRIWGFIEPL